MSKLQKVSKMLHFDMIGRVYVEQLQDVLKMYDTLFSISTERQDTSGSPHVDTNTIYLRMPKIVDLNTIFDSMEVTDWPIMENEVFADAVSAVARLAYGNPARAMIVRLAPGGVIRPHVDEGSYSKATEQYHLCVSGNDKCEMRISNFMGSKVETVIPKVGECWWFDKHNWHTCVNDGTTPRIHLIVDIWV
jgi:hypothetical protein